MIYSTSEGVRRVLIEVRMALAAITPWWASQLSNQTKLHYWYDHPYLRWAACSQVYKCHGQESGQNARIRCKNPHSVPRFYTVLDQSICEILNPLSPMKSTQRAGNKLQLPPLTRLTRLRKCISLDPSHLYGRLRSCQDRFVQLSRESLRDSCIIHVWCFVVQLLLSTYQRLEVSW